MIDPLAAFAVVALVLTIAALASPAVERLPISFPVIFLALGVVLGPRAIGLVDVSLHDPLLEVVATVTLALVLFLDAVQVQLDELRTHRILPVLILGPGTVLIVAAVAGISLALFALPLVAALMIGAALASTDPVVLRDLVRDGRIPRSIRQTLKLEAGLNDLVVLPILLIVIAVATARATEAGAWAVLLAQILVVGPVIGFAVGGAGSWAMGQLDARYGVRREFQALYGVGLVLAAYVSGAAAGGDGFLAAFAAGLAVPVLNTSLCDCFLEYGEVTAEMAMLLAFILFGAVLSVTLGTADLWLAVLLAMIAIGAVRPIVMRGVLHRAHLSGPARAFLGWFGPRGLNSLLLALLVVQAGVADGERIFSIVGVVVLVSAVLHGVSATPLAAWYGRRVAAKTLAEEREGTVGGLFETRPDDAPVISVGDLRAQLATPHPPLLLDVRSRGDFERDRHALPGAQHVTPDEIVAWAATQSREQPIVTICA